MSNSWGNYPSSNPAAVSFPFWKDSIDSDFGLAYGLGRSYGDVCLNNNGKITKTPYLDRIISFDKVNGVITAEAGISFDTLLKFIVPHGWFIPVSPGTKFVTLGGAIANDIHGKNHHLAGTIGLHTLGFDLFRSDGLFKCSQDENSSLFNSTIGGLGLTGIITEATVKLRKIQSSKIAVVQTPFSTLEEFDYLSKNNSEYTVAWIDCVKVRMNRGIFISGDHAIDNIDLSVHKKPLLDIPFFFPKFTLNSFTVRAFNECYYQFNALKPKNFNAHYNPFFYPLDVINNWNRIYGRRGFIQLQVVVPELEQIRTILKIVKDEKLASFLAVLKKFGSNSSPGILSFPRAGYTLCLDFITRTETIPLIKKLCDLTIGFGGGLYPAKDAVMSKDNFIRSYPNYEEWLRHKDQNISSNFFRRIFES